MSATTQILRIEDIRPSANNPRKSLGDIEGLMASIKEKGLLQAILVRPADGLEPYEVVSGNRRFEACRRLDFEGIEAKVRALSDEEARECQIVENAQREDVPPLEEAEAYAWLVEHRGHRPETVAERVGKSALYVRRRLELVRLGEPAKALLRTGSITVAGALVLGRLSDPATQTAAVEELAELADGRAQDITLGDIRRTVDHMTRRLAHAPWSLSDAELVPAAGACSACPRRTDAQADLFGDALSEHDACTDAACWRAKAEATVARHAAAGAAVLDAERTAELFRWGDYLHWDKDLVEVSTIQPEEAEGLPRTVALTPRGGVVEMVHRADVERLAQPGARNAARRKETDWEAEQKRKKAKAEALMRAQVDALCRAARPLLELVGEDAGPALQILARAMASAWPFDVTHDALPAVKRGKGTSDRERLHTHAAAQDASTVAGRVALGELVLELIARAGTQYSLVPVKDVLAAFGVAKVAAPKKTAAKKASAKKTKKALVVDPSQGTSYIDGPRKGEGAAAKAVAKRKVAKRKVAKKKVARP